MASAHQTIPLASTADPAATTTAGPNLAISLPATRNENSSTMIGPGATARPVRRADQPQSSWAHSTIDSSMAPNAIENSSITTVAPVKARARNRAGSTSGLADRAQCSANRASRTTAAASTSKVRADPQPQSPPSARPRVSAPTPALTRAAPSASGRGTGWPGTSGSRSQPTTSAARSARPPPPRRGGAGHPSGGGPGPDRAAAPLGRVAGQHQAQRGRGQQGRARRLDQPEPDQHGDAGGRAAGGRGR